MRASPLAVLPLLLLPAGARAQACFRGQPAPRCGTVWIAEVTVERRSGGLLGTSFDELWPYGSMAVGGMRNVSARWALGGAIVFTFGGFADETADDDHPAGGYGAMARVRRWLAPEVSLELQAGLWRLSDLSPGVELALNGGDLVALTVGARARRLLPREGEFYAGLRLGSYAGLAAAVYHILAGIASVGGT